MNHFHPICSIISCMGLVLLISCGKSEQEAPRPNILFAIADDASYPHMGAYGTDWVYTPAFDQVAKHGLLFNNAYTPNAKCAPSRACILTGRNSWQLEAACNHMPFFPEKFITFGEALPKADYFVGHTAKGWAPGEAKKDGIPRMLIGPPYNEHTVTPPAKYISGNDYARNFESFLDARPVEQPFFFWYGSTEPHRAYEYGAGINKGRKSLSDIDQVPPFWPDSDTVRTDMLDYAFEIEYFDEHLGQMLAVLESRKLLANTLVVVTADNGMPFPRVKGQVYEMDNHLPLAMMWLDGIESPGRTVDDYVSFVDFAPTFLELAGLTESESTMQPITGHSLTPYFQDKDPQPLRDFMIVGKERHDIGRPHDWGYPVRSIIKHDLMYTENFKPERWPAGNPETGYLNTDGSPTKTEILDLRRSGTDSSFWMMSFGKRPEAELYNIAEDPYCLHNVIHDPAYNEQIEELRRQMYAQLKAEGDPRILGKGDVFDEYPAASKAANFYDRWLKGEKVATGWVNESDFEPIGKLKN